MQIHELNDYVGSLGAASYLAIDNGSDTGKLSTQQLLTATNQAISDLDTNLNARIDNIIAGGDAPSAAEVTDARLGAAVLGGITYPSLGDAIRGQATDVANKINDIVDTLKTDGIIYLERDFLKWEHGSINASDQEVSDNRNDFARTIGYYHSDTPIELTMRETPVTGAIVYLVYTYDGVSYTLESRTVMPTTSKTITLDPTRYYRFCVTATNISYVIDLDNVSVYGIFEVEGFQDVGGVLRLPQLYSTIGSDRLTYENPGGVVTAGTPIELTDFPKNLKSRHSYSFSAGFATFSKLIIGQGYQQYRGRWIEIDNTNVVVKRYEESEVIVGTIAHGLTFVDQMSISFDIQTDGTGNCVIESESGVFIHTFNMGYEVNGTYFVIGNQNMTGIVFNVVASAFKQPLWMFGDSYFGVDDNRVIGQLKNFGYFDNLLIDGLAGQNSSDAFAELEKCLKYGTPKYLVWCIGINDPSLAAYQSVYNDLIEICTRKRITLILYRIPSVTSKLTENEAINSFVTGTGYRYINAYRAVTKSTAGTWFDGMLSGDGVHPTNLGAQALAIRFLIDVPEIMEYQ